MTSETRETSDLIASDRVEGTVVYDSAGEKLGHIERFMVDKRSGQVEYAVLSFGGFLGVGDHHYPLPWHALTYDIAKGGYVVDISRDVIEGAPSHPRDENPEYDPDYGRMIYGYYGLTYF